jgi:hypothetical protein
MAKLKFGTYSLAIHVNIAEQVEIEYYFTKEQWNKLKADEQVDWLRQYCEDIAISDLEKNWNLIK